MSAAFATLCAVRRAYSEFPDHYGWLEVKACERDYRDAARALALATV